MLTILYKTFGLVAPKSLAALKECHTIVKNIEISYFGRMENSISSANNNKKTIYN
jgi:hypothetical protein